MGSLYDRADIYDLLEDENRYNAYKEHWKAITDKKEIKTMLDVSIGSGSVTLPVTDLGIELSGSDLSDSMLANCKKKAEKAGKKVTLMQSDFRSLECWGNQKFDLVASTGNSLGYVSNEDIVNTLKAMDSHVAPGGYIYIDTRNWEKIQREHQRFYLYNPFFDGETRINLVQVWDYPNDSSIVFNLLYTFEKNNQIFQKERFEENYHPFTKKLLTDTLETLGYRDINLLCFPAQFAMRAFEDTDWYTIVAHK